MYFDYSRAKTTAANPVIALKTVYMVEADPSYDVTNQNYDRKGYIALRTIRGCGIVCIEGLAPLTVNKETLLIFDFSKIERYYCFGDHWDFWWFEFSAASPLAFQLNKIFDIKVFEDEQNYCQRCLEYLRRDAGSSTALATAYLNTLLAQWFFLLQESPIQANVYYSGVCKVIDYMRSNLSENISLQQMARMMCLCERRFREVFKEITRMQPKKYYDGLRLEFSTELLKNTSLRIMDISDRLGYSSQFHFTKAFVKHYGISPKEYRK